jgi:hypothetical protein
MGTDSSAYSSEYTHPVWAGEAYTGDDGWGTAGHSHRLDSTHSTLQYLCHLGPFLITLLVYPFAVVITPLLGTVV